MFRSEQHCVEPAPAAAIMLPVSRGTQNMLRAFKPLQCTTTTVRTMVLQVPAGASCACICPWRRRKVGAQLTITERPRDANAMPLCTLPIFHCSLFPAVRAASCFRSSQWVSVSPFGARQPCVHIVACPRGKNTCLKGLLCCRLYVPGSVMGFKRCVPFELPHTSACSPRCSVHSVYNYLAQCFGSFEVQGQNQSAQQLLPAEA